MQRDLLMLENLNCPTCAAQLEAAARKTPGVTQAKVSFATGTLDISYDQAKVRQTAIFDMVRRHGVSVAAVVPGDAR